jgi:hypothetical protein
MSKEMFNKEFKEALAALPGKEKDKLVLRLLRKDYILANRYYFELVADDSIEELRAKLEEKVSKKAAYFKTRFYTLGTLMMDVRYLSGEITEHVAITKDKYGEVSLSLLMLTEVLKQNNERIANSSYGQAEKFCVYVIARIYKILGLTIKLHEDLQWEFKEGFEELFGLLTENKHLLKTTINHGLDLNWLQNLEIPLEIDQIAKDLRKNGFLR